MINTRRARIVRRSPNTHRRFLKQFYRMGYPKPVAYEGFFYENIRERLEEMRLDLMKKYLAQPIEGAIDREKLTMTLDHAKGDDK